MSNPAFESSPGPVGEQPWHEVVSRQVAKRRFGSVRTLIFKPTSKIKNHDLIPDKLQLVGRYTYSHGDGPASVVAQTRYERETPIGPIPGVAGSRNRGDEYNAVYLGAQYFIYGNKLKLMAGAEWARLSRDGHPTGYDGITTLTGIRFSF